MWKQATSFKVAIRRSSNLVGHLVQQAEHGFHLAYLGGVALGGGYRYAAIGMLVCIALTWLLRAAENDIAGVSASQDRADSGTGEQHSSEPSLG